MPFGKGTYGKKVGRPSNKAKAKGRSMMTKAGKGVMTQADAMRLKKALAKKKTAKKKK